MMSRCLSIKRARIIRPTEAVKHCPAMKIKDAITATVSAHTEDECREDMEGLKEEILKSVQDLFQSDFIYKVAISGVKFG